MRFFERFRAALSRYAEGVHVLGAPATQAAIEAAEARLGRRLPDGYRDFLGQWNGALLFHEAVTVYGVAGGLDGAEPDLARLRAVGETLEFGAGEAGPLRLDGAGRVLAIDADTERAVVAGSSFERWLDATMAREALLYDRDGEFRDQAFDHGELTEKVARKRAEAGIKADPDAPAWHQEIGFLCLAGGKTDAAIEALERAVELDRSLADAWFAVAKLRRDAGDREGAVAAFRSAASAETAPEEAAFALAHAARVARSLGAIADGDRLGAEATALHPPLVAEQKTAAAHLLDEQDFEGAIDRLELALAVTPTDPDLTRLLRLARARRALRPI